MILIINTASTLKGGGVQVAKSFIEECINYTNNKYHIILSNTLAKSLNREMFPENFFFYEIGYRPATKVFSFSSHNKFFSRLEKEIMPDVIFTTSGPAYWRPKSPHLIGYNLGHCIYPESPYFKIIGIKRRTKWFLKSLIIKRFFAKDADAYVVQTDDVNKRLRKWLNTDKVYTVSNTCSSYFYSPKVCTDKLPRKNTGEFRMLTLSAWYPHKNLSIIKETIDCFTEEEKQKIRFVLTLPDDIFKNNFSDKYRNNVINVGQVKLEEAPHLYKECDAMFLPTLIECFSASYVEAMAIGKPILTSNLGFAHTVCKDAAYYFDPLDARSIAEVVRKLYNSPEKQAVLVENGKLRMKTFLNAQQRAKSYLELCKNMINEHI